MSCIRKRARIRVFFKLFAFWVICSGFSVEHVFWQPVRDGIPEKHIRAITATGIGIDSILFAATDRGVYRGKAGGSSFEHVLGFEIGDQRVYSISAQENWAALATAQGIWESTDSGNHWKRTFNPASASHRRCYSILKRGDYIFIGTAKGLFYKNILQNTWYHHTGVLGRQAVFDIVGTETGVFVSTEDGIYFAKTPERQVASLHANGSVVKFETQSESDVEDKGNSTYFRFAKIFSIAGNSYENIGGGDSGATTPIDTLYEERFIRGIAYQESRLFIFTKTGIWSIKKGDKSPGRISSTGVPLQDIYDIEVGEIYLTSHGQCSQDFSRDTHHVEPEPALFLSTQKGVFVFFHNEWVNLYRGLTTQDISGLTIDHQGGIFVATNSGVFSLMEEKQRAMDYSSAKEKFAHEPSVQEVQQMVIAYADVGKSKIDSWKAQARLKSFLPSVSLDFDRDATDLYHWNTGASPDELQKGVSTVDWGVGLNWDLSEVIWSTDQTSIDSRSKLMVELRDDLINQASRIYFERRRLQMELLEIPAQDPERWQKEMRVDELTAGLDGLTGGRFSEKI